MALAHRELPLYGVQFHPESVATAYGDTLIRNFCGMVAASRPALCAPPSCPGLLLSLVAQRPSSVYRVFNNLVC